MADDADTGDDVGWWNCSLCTYKNSADKFKCEICDLRRGTSTRKPRCNADTIVAQVVKQQEQIRQQTRSKPSPKSRSNNTSILDKVVTPSSSNDLANNGSKKKRLFNDEREHEDDETSDSSEPASPLPPAPPSKSKKSNVSKNTNNKKVKLSSDDRLAESGATSDSMSQFEENFDGSDPSAARKRLSKKSKSSSSSKKAPKKSSNNESSSNTTSIPVHYADSDSSSHGGGGGGGASTDGLSSASEPESDASSDNTLGPWSRVDQSRTSPPIELSPVKSSANPLKYPPVPIEIGGNLIKYSPPTSTGRTGLIIDKKKFTQHSVTVNDVTITFTEFATRQNKYIRKKKRRDDNRSRGHTSSSKSEPKTSSSNNNVPAATPTARGDS